MKKRWWVTLVGAGAVVALALAVGASAGGSRVAATNISVWAHQGQEGEVAAIQNAVKAFNASQKDIVAELKFIPEADYTKTVQATPAGSLPDVLEYDGPLMSGFVYDNKLQPVTGLVSAKTVANQSASVKTQNTYSGDGKLYGVSQFDSGLALYGNAKLLKAAGIPWPTAPGKAWTAAQFSAALAKLAAKDKDGKVLDIKENYGGEWPTYGFLPIVYSAGVQPIAGGKAEGALNSAKVVKAVQTFASWRKYVDPNTDDKAFVTGRVALSWVGHWMFNPYNDALGKDMVLIPLPSFGNGAKSGMGSWAWGVGKESENAAAAGKFLDFLMTDKNVAAMTTANGAPPATRTVFPKSALYKPGGKLYLYTQQLAAACGSKAPTRTCVAAPRPVTPGYAVFSKQFSDAFFGAYKGGNAKDLLDKAARAIDLDAKDNDNYGLD